MAKRASDAGSPGQFAERALGLTVAALILLTPPILTIFNVPVTVVGIPLLYLYCFTIWALAIVLGGRLALRMTRTKPEGAASQKIGHAES
jgi:hypothetical protein